ncbi:MAG: hypothetical protein ACFHU9_15630 [Fluviicola sp.]
MKTVLSLLFVIMVLHVFAQQSRPVEFGIGLTTSMVRSDSVNEYMTQSNSAYGDLRLNRSFGLDASLKFHPLAYLKVGIVGSLDRSSISGPVEYSIVTSSPQDTLYGTGNATAQLSSYSYGITSDFVYSRLFFPEMEKSELFLSAGLLRSHVFLRDRIYNPFWHNEFYNLNHLGVSWTYQLGLGYNYVVKNNDFIQTIGVQLIYCGLRNSSLQSRVYGSDFDSEVQNPNITAGMQSLGLQFSFGLAR